ncbi:MAG: hypothetical protein Q8N62_05350 [Candidatus Omnitrophota bacterium]|nr:hypothetical protein [Candidatus Omnitrophota bacterium]
MDELVNVDFKRELLSNSGLREANEQHKNEAKDRLRRDTIERRKLLYQKMILSLGWILLAAVSGLLISVFGFHRQIFYENKYVGLLSIFCFSWATLARLGWQGQTCAGDTIFEKLDENIFWVLYFFGTLFGAFSIIAS